MFLVFLRHLVPWPSIDIQSIFHGDRPRGIPRSEEWVGKYKRGAQYNDFGIIEGYISDINAWLNACRRLRLNAAKTQLLWLGSSQLLDKVDCRDVLVLGTRVAISDTARDLGVVIDSELSLAAHVTAVCRSGYNQLRQLRAVVRSLSVNATKMLVRRSSRVVWTTATHCCTASTMDYFVASSQCRTLPPAWSQALVVVTTSHQCYGSCTGYQSVSESCSRSRGSCIIRSLYDCRLLSDVGRRPLRSNSNDMEAACATNT